MPNVSIEHETPTRRRSSRLTTITCIWRGERVVLTEATWRYEYLLKNVEAVPLVLGCHVDSKWRVM